MFIISTIEVVVDVVAVDGIVVGDNVVVVDGVIIVVLLMADGACFEHFDCFLPCLPVIGIVGVDIAAGTY